MAYAITGWFIRWRGEHDAPWPEQKSGGLSAGRGTPRSWSLTRTLTGLSRWRGEHIIVAGRTVETFTGLSRWRRNTQ